MTPFRLLLGWLPTTRYREYRLCSLAYAAIAHGNPSYLAKMFRHTASEAAIRSSSRLPPRPLIAPISRTEAFKQSFVVTAFSLINILGHVTFSEQHIASFKADLFNIPLARDRGDWDRRVAFLALVSALPTPAHEHEHFPPSHIIKLLALARGRGRVVLWRYCCKLQPSVLAVELSNAV